MRGWSLCNLTHACGVPIVMFSCRRELVGGLMGAIAGHYNGLRKGVQVHCDVNERNIWLRVPQFLVKGIVPSWDYQDGKGFVQRAGVLGDWGSAQDPQRERQGFVTGTLPFIATELLSDCHQEGKISHAAYHDLESFFWVLWSISINAAGPYGKPRRWLTAAIPNSSQAADRSPSPSSSETHPVHQLIPTTNMPKGEAIVGGTRRAADSNNFPVPAWATRENVIFTCDEVYMWRLGANEILVCEPISPYFLEGKGGSAFKEGMRKLLQYFTVSSSRAAEDRITHKIFIDILRNMRDAIDPEEDRPSAEEVRGARAGYEKCANLGK